MPHFKEVEIEEVDVEKEIAELDLIPVMDRIVIKEITVKKVGSLYVPESARDGEMQTNEGYVLAVGEDVKLVKPGDRVYYGRYSGFNCQYGNKKYRIMNEEDIICIVKNGGEQSA